MMRKKYYKKLFRVFTLIVMANAIIVTILVFYNSYSLYKKDREKKKEDFLTQVQTNIDMKLEVVEGMMEQLKVNEYAIKFARDEGSDRYIVLKFMNEINKTCSALSKFGFHLGVTTPKSDLIVTPEYTVGRARFFNDFSFQESELARMQKFLSDSSGRNDKEIFIFKELNSPFTMTIVERKQIDKFSELIFFVSFYEESFLYEKILDKDEYLGIINKSDLVIKPTIIEDKNNLFVPKELYSKIVSGVKNQRNSVKKDDFITYFQPSHVENWYYLYISPIESLSVIFQELLFKSLSLYFLLSVAGLFIAYGIANITYTPIRKVTSLFDKIWGTEAEDEFLTIRDTAVSIDKTNKRLNEIIKNNKLDLKKKFLRDLVLGSISNSEIGPVVQKYKLDSLNSNPAVILFEISNYQDLENNYLKETIIKVKSQIMTMIGVLLDSGIPYELLEIDASRFAVIFPGENYDNLKLLISEGLKNIRTDFELEMAAAIGEKTDSLESLDKSYNDALHMLEYKHIRTGMEIITHDDIADIKNETYYYPIDVERDIMSSVIRGKKNELLALLRKIMTENIDNRKIDDETLSQFLFGVMATLNRILQQVNISNAEIFGENEIAFLNVTENRNRKKIKKEVEYCFTKLIDKIEENNKNKNESISEDLISYVQENYMWDFSLDNMADNFNLTPAYVSVLFKKYIGQNFKDYLNEYRINAAKKILDENKNIKVKDLAGKVGFNNVNSFIRVFNKYEGMSPGNYLK